MDWSKGYSASYYATTIDTATWRETGIFAITGGSIKRESTGKRQSADVRCINHPVTVEQWVRIYLDAKQDGASAHVPLFTGLAASPDTDINGTLKTNTLMCYSVLKPAEDVILPRGWYAMQGANGAELVKALLSVSPAPIIITGTAPALAETIIAEDNETRLSMADRILTAIGWRLRIDGDGTINIMSKTSASVATLDPIENDVIETQIKVSADWYSCPNVYMAVSGDMTGIARDESDGPLSVQNRGREVWQVETGCALGETESIAAYAMRRLKEAQTVQKSASYSRRFLPGVMPEDVITMRYPEQGLTGDYTVTNQTITLGYGAKTSESIATAAVLTTQKTREPALYYLIDDNTDHIVTDGGDRILIIA